MARAGLFFIALFFFFFTLTKSVSQVVERRYTILFSGTRRLTGVYWGVQQVGLEWSVFSHHHH